MKDSRLPLSEGTQLEFKNRDQSPVIYTIQREIGRGGRCIAYDGYYSDNLGFKHTVRIKELYPCKLRIDRNPGGVLSVRPEDLSAFEEQKAKFLKAYQQNTLLRESLSTDFISNPVDVYLNQVNNTIYLVSNFDKGALLNYDPSRSLQDRLLIIKGICLALQEIHRVGYLYLDLKPENVFLLSGSKDHIHLFDFDSLYPYGRSADKESLYDYHISFTRGFAPLEQKTGNARRLGRYSDIFSIGALLFYLLYHRTPDPFDLETDAVYPFPEISGSSEHDYPDSFLNKLKDFFHHTLACYWQDRYQDISELLPCLEVLIALASPSALFVKSTVLWKPSCFVGREKELDQLRLWSMTKSPCLFLSGMGGIGKSTLIRAYLAQNRQDFDTILYLSCKKTLRDTIIDDQAVHINTVHKAEKESAEDYFTRKLRALKDIFHEQRGLLVLDNFDHPIDEDFLSLLDLGCRILVGCRNTDIPAEYDRIALSAIEDRESLYALFSQNAGKGLSKEELSPEDLPYIDNIIKKTGSHTLVLELIARQIAESYLTIKQASDLVDERGFSNIAPEKVSYTRDLTRSYQTIESIINSLFSTDHLGKDHLHCLQFLSLFGPDGIPVQELQDGLHLESKDLINELYRGGWLNLHNGIVSFHPVIAETVKNWKWDIEVRMLVDEYLHTLNTALWSELLKKEMPRDFHNFMNIPVKMPFGKFILDHTNLEKLVHHESSAIAANIAKSWWDDLSSQTPGIPDPQILDKKFALGEQIVINGLSSEHLNKLDSYILCLILLVLYYPVDREDSIIISGRAVLERLSAPDYIFQQPVLTYLISRVLQRLVSTYLEKREFDSALQMLKDNRHLLEWNNNYFIGSYYDAMSSYYDSRLEGAYYQDNERGDRKQLLDCLDRALCHFEKKHHFMLIPFARLAQANALLSKVTVLMREEEMNRAEVKALFARITKLVQKHAMPYSKLFTQYQMVSARYYSDIEDNFDRMEASLAGAFDSGGKSFHSDLERVDGLYIPAADLYMEWREHKKAEQILKDAIALCRQHEEVVPYIRKSIELQTYMIDVYGQQGNLRRCYDQIQAIDAENEKYHGIGVYVPVPEFTRQWIYEHVDQSEPGSR